MPLIPVTSGFIPVTESRGQKRQRLVGEQQSLEQEPEPTTLGQLPSVAGEVGRNVVGGALEGVASVPETIGRVGQKIERTVTGESSPDEQYGTLNASQRLRELARGIIGDNPNPSFMLDKVPKAIGSMGTMLLGGGAARALGVGPVLGTAATGALMGGGAGHERAVAAGANPDEAFNALIGNALLGTTEAIPLAGMLKRLDGASGGALRQAAVEGTEEALQEAFQSVMGNAIAETLTPEDVALLEGLGENAGVGGTSGILMSLLVSGLSRRTPNAAGQIGQALQQNVDGSEFQDQSLERTLPQNAQQTTDRRITQPPNMVQRLAQSVGAAKGDSEKVGTPVVEPEKQPRGQFYADAPHVLRGEGFGIKSGAKVDGRQLGNRLKNLITPGEYMALEEEGLGEFLKEKRTPEEVAQWAEEKAPKVEVKALFPGAFDDTGLASANHFHTLETAGFEMVPVLDMYDEVDDVQLVDRRTGEEVTTPWSQLPQNVAEAARFFAANPDRINPLDDNTPTSDSATARFTEVNPKELKDMPGALDLLVRVPLSDLDKSSSNMGARPEKYRSSHYPKEGANLLAHVRGYMEERDGKKVFHVFEMQSDWAQDQKKEQTLLKDPEYQAKRGRDAKPSVASHPLLKHYERLALKAAIDYARKQGADAIAVSDAETAMITEGHDTQGASRGPFATEAEANADRFRSETNAEIVKMDDGFYIHEGIPQSKGMRLHYDRTLPKVAEELTGEKGEVVEFGEHKNAFDAGTAFPVENRATRSIRRRPNLIFRNPDGTPKTSITARLYPIRNARKEFSLFGSDKAQKPTAPAVFKGTQEGFGKFPAVDLWNLTEDVGDRAAGSTVSSKTLLDAGFALPKKGLKPKINPKAGQQGFIRLPKGMRPKMSQPLPQQLLPDMLPKQEANEEFSKKFGAEKWPVFGELLGGKGAWAKDRPRLFTEEDRAVATWYHEYHGTSRAVASNVGEQIRGEFNDAFKVNKKTGDMNVKALKPGLSLKASDVFEELQRDPKAYQLTPEQHRVLRNMLNALLGRMGVLVKQYQLTTLLGEYFPRGTAKPPKGRRARTGGRGPGAVPGFAKQRTFATEKEGWDLGYTFETDLEARLVQAVENLYKAIADRRLSRDPVMGGRTKKRIIQDLRLAYPQYPIDRIKNMARSVMAQGTINSNLFRNRYFAPDVAQTLNREFAAEHSQIRKAISSANSFAKALQLGFDFGVGQIQLLPTAFNRPDIWAKSQAIAFASLMSKDTFSYYARNNRDVIIEMSKYGMSVGRLEEYMSGIGSSLPKTLEGLPVVGSTVGKVAAGVTRAFGRHFQSALDVAKVEMWKAWRPVTDKGELNRMAQAIETVTLSARMESVMVPHNRALLERVIFLAPSYYRGAVNFVTGLTESGVSGKIIRRSMSRFILGGVALYVGVAMKLGMDDEEIAERLNPANSAFLMWRVKDGELEVNVGLGGIIRSFMRLGAQVADFVKDPKSKWVDVKRNPLVRWVRGHSSPLVQHTWSLTSGKDYLDEDHDLTKSLKGALPLALEAKTAGEFKMQTVGLQVWPARGPTAEQVAKKMFGKEVDDLSRSQRRTVTLKVKENAPPKDAGDRKRAARLALEYGLERQERVGKGLSKVAQRFLKTHGFNPPGYSASEAIGGVTVRFTEKEAEVFEKALIEETEVAIERLRGQDWTNLTDRQKKVRYDRLIEVARKKAHSKMRRLSR